MKSSPERIEYMKKYCMDNAERLSLYQRAYYRKNNSLVKTKRQLERMKARKDTLIYLGGKCVKCGFNDFRALQIDHVHGSGTEQRRIQGKTHLINPVIYLRHIQENPDLYQLLCANCNWIKRFENNENRQ